MDTSPRLPELLEPHIDEIAQAVAQRVQSNAERPPETQEDERMIVQEAIRTIVDRDTSHPELAAVPPQPPTPTDNQILDVLPAYLRRDGSDPVEQQSVERLVSLFLSHGIVRAVRAAERESPAVLDAFHDALVDILLPELKRRGRWGGA